MTATPLPETLPRNRGDHHSAYAIVVFALAGLIGVLEVIFGQWDHDGGAYLMRGAYVASGLRPYLDYPSIYPPLMDVLTALLVSVPVRRIVLAVAIPLVWIGANTAATAKLAGATSRDRALPLLVASLFPLFAARNGGNHLTLEYGVSLFACLSFVPIARRDTRPRALAASALFAVAATLCKQNGALAFLPLIAFAIEQRAAMTRRHLWTAIVAAASPLLLTVLWIRDVGALVDSLFGALSWYAGQRADFRQLTFASEWQRSPETVILLAAVAVIAAALVARGTRRLVVTAAAAGAVGELLPRLIRNYPHYDINIWPFLALIVVIALAAENNAIQRGTRLFVAAFATLASLFVVFTAPWRGTSALLSTFEPVAAQVAAVTPPAGVVRQYGSEPIVEFLASRREEIVNKPYAAVFGAVWDGSGVYAEAPSPGTTVVAVWTGQPWMAQRLQALAAQGFVRIGVYGVFPRVAVFVHRSRGLPKTSQ